MFISHATCTATNYIPPYCQCSKHIAIMNPSIDLVLSIAYPMISQSSHNARFEDSAAQVPWNNSTSNIQYRIDSLHPLSNSIWRVDGCEVDGAHYFVIPNFMLGKVPLHIDTYIPHRSSLPVSLRDVLQTDLAIFTPNSRVDSLNISNYIVRALQAWSDRQPDLESLYASMPFGSRIVFNTITSDVRAADIQLVPNFDLERQWLSMSALKNMWRLGVENWPETIDLEKLMFVKRLHDTISVVQISQNGGAQEYIFKFVLHDVKYFYHELKNLLTMPPHPSIISRPLFIVTKKCRFGGKVGVCGFVLEYHPFGTLQTVISNLPSDPKLRLANQLRWAKQLVSGLQHIQASPVQFYSNLKLSNVVMKASDAGGEALDAVLIDFEQRSGFFTWAAPEVRYVHVLEHLATFSADEGSRSRYAGMLRDYIAAWQPLNSKITYRNPRHGYSFPWLALTPREREAAQVFMLGKVLWCIFEGASSPGGCISIETFREEASEVKFPEFFRTPKGMRDCIRKCTAGAAEWQGREFGVVRRGNKLFPLGNVDVKNGQAVTVEEIEEAAREWWREEISDAEDFLQTRTHSQLGKSDIAEKFAYIKERPSLTEVADMIAKSTEVDLV